MRLFQGFQLIYGEGVAPIDRTGVIKFPVRTKSLFPLPQMRVMDKTYEQLCDERAREVLGYNGPLHVFWSGGIDSTCLLVSLLKARGGDRITVLMNRDSIAEYPYFYHTHIRGKLRTVSSASFGG